MPIKFVTVEYIDFSEFDAQNDRLKITLESEEVLYFTASNPTRPYWLYIDFDLSDEKPVDRLVQMLIGNHRCGTDVPVEPQVRRSMAALIEMANPGATTSGYRKPLTIGATLSVLAGPDQWGNSDYPLGRIVKIECIQVVETKVAS